MGRNLPAKPVFVAEIHFAASPHRCEVGRRASSQIGQFLLIVHLSQRLKYRPQVLNESSYPWFSLQSGRLLCLLRDATDLPWSMVDDNSFENLIQWFIMSADSKLILNYEQRHKLDTCVLK